MAQIEKYFIHACSSKYKELGFIRKHLTFARINQDVIQSFTFRKTSFEPSCYVEFGLYLFGMPAPIYLDAGNYRLDKLVPASQFESPVWPFDPHSDESISNCVECVINAIDYYLIPLFNTCKNSQSTFNELIKLEKIIENNRLRLLQQWGTDDCAKPFYERSLFDSKKYYIALKSQNYSYAYRFLTQQICWHTKNLEHLKQSEGTQQPESVKQRHVESLAKYTEHMKRLETHDYDFFDQLLNANEIQLRQFLEKQYPMLFKHRNSRPDR